jgi:hypothetical protein
LVIVSADLYALFAPLTPPLEGGGEVFFAEGSDDPLPGVLEGVLGQGEASQLLGEQEKVRWGQVRRVGGMINHLDLSGGQPIPDHGGSVDRDIVPMDKPLSLGHYWPLLSENLHELAQGFHDVVGIHRVPP